MFARIFGWGKETVPIEEETIPIEEVPNSPIKNLQDAIDELTGMEESFAKVTRDPDIVGSWMFLKGIDLIRVLDATVYNAKFDNKLCDVKMILSSVEYGFSQLLCTQSDCSEKAIMWHKLSNDTPAELYCEEHSNLVDSSSKGQHFRKIINCCTNGVFEADNPNKDMVAYSNIEERLFKEYENLKNTLSGMSLKANQIINKEVTERTPRYEHFTFVKLDSLS